MFVLKNMDIYQTLTKDNGGACFYEKILQIEEIAKVVNLSLIVEIGTYFGCFILPVSKLVPQAKCVAVDPYCYYQQHDIVDPQVALSAMAITTNSEHLEKCYNSVIENIAKWNLNVEVIRKTSIDAIGHFEDNSIDLLHIDGNHDFEAVYSDLAFYYDKVKDDGYIIMDDTNWISVSGAIDKFINSGKQLTLVDDNGLYRIYRKM